MVYKAKDRETGELVALKKVHAIVALRSYRSHDFQYFHLLIIFR